MTNGDLELLRGGWLPGQVRWDDPAVGEATVDWLHCEDRRFTEPFLENTFQKAMRRPFNVLFRHRTPLESLERWAEASPGIAPTGFIFHVSRCGSTLLAGLLGALPGTLVLSEPAPVDNLVCANEKQARLEEPRQIALLRAMVSALGQRREPGQDRLFVKFDAWHTLHFPLIRAAFPDVPWVFLYRDPVEVLVSALRQRGLHTVPGYLDAARLGLDQGEIFAMPPEEYGARVLSAIYQAGLEAHVPGRSLLVNYTQLPEAAWTTVAAHFGLEPDPGQIALLRDRAQWNAKSGMSFEPDSEQKQETASDAQREMATRFVQSVYSELEAARGG